MESADELVKPNDHGWCSVVICSRRSDCWLDGVAYCLDHACDLIERADVVGASPIMRELLPTLFESF